MNYSLNGSDWKLMGHWPYTPLWGKSMETGEDLLGVTDWIPSSVPGTVQLDLLKAGLIPDPYFETNSLLCEWVENRWWQYRKIFSLPSLDRTERITLDFEGVDYATHFFLNGQKLGYHEGMYEPVSYDIAPLLKDENRLDVMLESAPQEFSQIGYTSKTTTQKARFGYKWDFCTHLVHLGIWEGVFLRATGPYRLEEVFAESDYRDGIGYVTFSGRVDGLGGRSDARLILSLFGNGLSDSVELMPDIKSRQFKVTLPVKDPSLWMPNGYGAQPLYQYTLTLFDSAGISDRREGKIGIRSLSYRQTEGAAYDALPYTPIINGTLIYLNGVNMTPLSHFYGALTHEDYEVILRQAREMGVNLIRVWGGGIIEKEDFYELCDTYGIMIWQEFIQSSSGIDNTPSKIPTFLALLECTAKSALLNRRSYTSLTFWSGGNELMNTTDHPVNYGDENISMLCGLVKKYDPRRFFLPSSASGPNSWLTDIPGTNHDIHGNWKYDGIRNHYTRYNHSDAMLQSEFGCEGLSSLEELKSILSPSHLKPTDMKTDLMWRHHGEWWDSYERDTDLFGPLTDLRRWIFLSQWIQGEAIRYILEANRRRAFACAGSFVWQLNEPWPNVSCTALIEHKGRSKLAAYQVKKAFAPRALSLMYESLIMPVDQPFSVSLYGHNIGESCMADAALTLYDLSGNCLFRKSASVCLSSNGSEFLFEVSPILPEIPFGLIIADLTLSSEGSCIYQNRLLFTQKETFPFAALQSLPSVSFRVNSAIGGLSLQNTGALAAFFPTLISTDLDRPLLVSDSPIALLPGEQISLAVSSLRGETLPEVLIRCLNAEDTRTTLS